MTGGLVRKEFRDLRPFLVLGAFLLLLDVAYSLTQQADMRPLGLSFEDIGGEIAMVLFLLAFAVGTGLLIREVDDRTLGFLDGLPVSRLRVFGIKTAVASVVLLLYPAGNLLLLAVLHVVARQSLDYALHPALLWQAFGMICVVTGVGLALGLLFGFLRNLCWLALALCVIVLQVLTIEWPALAALNPLKLLDPQLVGLHWQVPVAGLVVQLVVLVTCVLLAMGMFVAAGGGQGRRLQQWLARPLVSAAVTLATIGVVIAAISLIMNASQEPAQHDTVAGIPSSTAQFVPSPPGNARTVHYSFSYPARQAEQVQAIMRDADRIHAEVAAILGVEAGARIDVDLSGSANNTDGMAFHDRFQMRLGPNASATLAHETVHVLARRLAGGERERELSKMSALNEGVAEWIEKRVSVGSGLTDLHRLQAAIVSRRHLLRPEQLTDIEALARIADRNLQYPLGAVLVDSIVARYGQESLHRLLSVLGDPDFPRDLHGAELWFAAFQMAGFDLALVFDDYARRLKAWESQFAEQIDALPRPRGSLVRGNGLVGVELRFDADLPSGWTAVVRFRPEQDSPLDRYSTHGVDGYLVAWTRAGSAVGGQLCFQPGVRAFGITIFEAWGCLLLDSAADWRD